MRNAFRVVTLSLALVTGTAAASSATDFTITPKGSPYSASLPAATPFAVYQRYMNLGSVVPASLLRVDDRCVSGKSRHRIVNLDSGKRHFGYRVDQVGQHATWC